MALFLWQGKHMKPNFSKPYDPKAVEADIYRREIESGFFNPDKLPTRHKKPFSMAMAPPNITGSLHLGHALEYTTSDVLIRWKRMQGYRVLWLPGTDHAGIATQNVVEKELKKEGLTRHDIGREKLIERIWQWKETYGDIILNQLKTLGVSCDWSRARFTMDLAYQEAVKTAFHHYYKKGFIYQAERAINWCTRCATSLSDLEIEYKEEDAEWYEIKYGPLMVGTTRPETKVGDTAVAVNPKDTRYKKYIGKELGVETVLGPAKIKVIADPEVDMHFGTGVMKVTPAHDLHDFELAEKYGLEKKQVIGPDGRMTALAGTYAGLSVKEARTQIVADLDTKGLLVSRKPYRHHVAICYRCGTVLEPILSTQWFLKMSYLAEQAIKAVKTGKVRFHPKRWEKLYFDWLNQKRDWCISRQIWWGHKIPLEGVDDVLDTWFSSALWPFATLGWPEKTKNLKTFYPTSALTNDRGIINLWDARMIFSGIEFMGGVPFGDLVIHATILTKEGKRMSKSLGTGIDPMNLMERYGADATRFGLIWQAMGGQDIRWNEEHMVAGKKFLNKIWNASRFVISKISNDKIKIPNNKSQKFTSHDKKVLKALKQVTKKTNMYLEKYEFGQALHDLYDFFWHQFCDIYLEASKKEAGPETPAVLLHTLTISLKLLHPFLPFITEHIWKMLPLKNKKLLLIEEWPK